VTKQFQNAGGQDLTRTKAALQFELINSCSQPPHPLLMKIGHLNAFNRCLMKEYRKISASITKDSMRCRSAQWTGQPGMQSVRK
jgi:hypothetical protein